MIWTTIAWAQLAYVSGEPIVAYDVSGAMPTPLGNIDTGYFVLDVAVSPDGGTLYAVAAQANVGYLLALNPRATDASSNPPQAILGKVAIGSAPFGRMALSPDGKTVYVANYGEGSVYIVDVSAAPKVTADIALCPGADGIVLSADGKIAYVACRNAAALGIIGTTGPSVTTVPAASGGSQLVPCEGLLCETYPGSARIDVVSAGVSIALPTGPDGIAISPNGNTLYATLFRGMGMIGGFVPIDLTTHPATVGTPIDVGRNPMGVTISVDGKTAYVANYDAAPGASGGSVSVVDIATAKVTATLAAGINPAHIALGAEPPPLAPSHTALTLDVTSAAIGQAVSASVVVSFPLAGITSTPGVPSGSVVISDAADSSVHCTITLVKGSGLTGAGSCPLAFGSPGTHTLTADYSGDVLYDPSSGSATETVIPVGLGLGFSPTSITAGATTNLTVSLSNASTSDVHVTSLIVTVPSGIAALSHISNDCSGSVGFTPTQIILSGGVIGLSSSCSFVVGTTSVTPGTYTFTVAAGDMQTTDGNNSVATSDSFTVTAPIAPTLSMNFSPATITAGGISTLTLTLGNANPTPLLLAGLGDALPSGLVIANPANAATTCPNAAVYATPGSGSIDVSNASVGLVTSIIPAQGSCTATVAVTSSTPGTYVNTIPTGALQTQTTYPPDSALVGPADNSTAPASATLTVSSAPLIATTTTLSASPNPATVGQSVTASVSVIGGTAPTSMIKMSTAAAATAPNGTVSIGDGKTSCTTALTNGSGSCALTFATPGAHLLTATYPGDASHATSSATFNETVNAVVATPAMPAPMLGHWALLALALALGLAGACDERRSYHRA